MAHSLHISKSFELHKHDSKKHLNFAQNSLGRTKTKILPQDSPHYTLVNTFGNFFNNKLNTILNTLPPATISYFTSINEKHNFQILWKSNTHQVYDCIYDEQPIRFNIYIRVGYNSTRIYSRCRTLPLIPPEFI